LLIFIDETKTMTKIPLIDGH